MATRRVVHRSEWQHADSGGTRRARQRYRHRRRNARGATRVRRGQRHAGAERQWLVHLHAGGRLLRSGRILLPRQRRAGDVDCRNGQPDRSRRRRQSTRPHRGHHDRSDCWHRLGQRDGIGHRDRCRRCRRRPVPSQRLAGRSRRHGVALQPRWNSTSVANGGRTCCPHEPETPRATSPRPRPCRSPSATSPSPASSPPTASTKVRARRSCDRSGRGHTGTISGATWSTQGQVRQRAVV